MKRFIFLMTLAVMASAVWACRAAEFIPATDLKGKKVLIVIASKNFQDKEFSVVRGRMSVRGAEVTVASSKMDECVAVDNSVKVKPDMLVKDAKAADFDAVVFIGGPGVAEYYEDNAALSLAKSAVEQKKALAAICLAPNVLAKAGLLKDKNATVYGDKKMLTDGGAKVSEEHVVTDGKLVTADGPAAALEFAAAVAMAMKSD